MEVLSVDTSGPLSESLQIKLRELIEPGLPHVAQPYLALAKELNVEERQVIEQIQQWQKNGLIRRFGLVVKHRQLGFKANAMVVWDIPVDIIDSIAHKLSAFDEVSLCYRRPRRLPDWPYNLFCMIHGKCRKTVVSQIENIANIIQETFPDNNINYDVLFSYKAYKQHGARYRKSENVVNMGKVNGIK